MLRRPGQYRRGQAAAQRGGPIGSANWAGQQRGPGPELLAEQRGRPGVLERLQPGAWSSHEPCAPFDPALFSGQQLMAGGMDGLVFAGLEILPAGGFSLQVGCRLDPQRLDLISIHFGADQCLECWERRRFSLAAGSTTAG